MFFPNFILRNAEFIRNAWKCILTNKLLNIGIYDFYFFQKFKCFLVICKALGTFETVMYKTFYVIITYLCVIFIGILIQCLILRGQFYQRNIKKFSFKHKLFCLNKYFSSYFDFYR